MEPFDPFLRNPESTDGSSTCKHPSFMLGCRTVVLFLSICPFSSSLYLLPSLFMHTFQPSQSVSGNAFCNYCSMVHNVCGKFVSSHISCKCSWCRMNTLDCSEASKWEVKLACNKPVSWGACGSLLCPQLWCQLVLGCDSPPQSRIHGFPSKQD